MKNSYAEYKRAVEVELGHRLEMWETSIVAASYQYGLTVAECVARLR